MRDVVLDRAHADLGVSNEATSENIAIEAQGEVLVFIRNYIRERRA